MKLIDCSLSKCRLKLELVFIIIIIIKVTVFSPYGLVM